MIPEVGRQVLVGDRPSVILAIERYDPLWVLLVFRPSTLAPPRVRGKPRASNWHSMASALLYDPEAEAFYLETNQRVGVRLNTDPQQHVDLPAWLAALGAEVLRQVPAGLG